MKRLHSIYFLFAFALFPVYAASTPFSSAVARGEPYSSNVIQVGKNGRPAAERIQTSQSDDHRHAINLQAALLLALKNSPALAAAIEEIKAKNAAAYQEGLRPNPELGLELENFAGQDELTGFRSLETTISYSRLVEVKNKRKLRRQAAFYESAIKEWDYRAKALDIIALAASAYFDVSFAQKQVELDYELLDIAEKTAAAVSLKVEAGKVAPMEKSRSEIELAFARTSANKSESELSAAKDRLAKMIGLEVEDISVIASETENLSMPDWEAGLADGIMNNPDYARWETEIGLSQSNYLLAVADSHSDLTLSAGIRNFRDADAFAFLLGISIPLAVTNKNQGKIEETIALIENAKASRDAAEIALRTEVSEALQNLSTAYIEAVALRDEILPKAGELYEANLLGYREGKFDLLQMLDAQRTLFDMKRQYLNSLKEYQSAKIRLNRLIGEIPEGAETVLTLGQGILEVEK